MLTSACPVHSKVFKIFRIPWHLSFRRVSGNCRPVFLQALKENYDTKLALVDNLGHHTYSDLLHRSASLAQHLINHARRDPVASKRTSSGIILNGERIGFLCQNNASYVIAQWGAWMSGGVAVPLCKFHPSEELEYTLTDSDCSLVVSTDEYSGKISPIARKLQIKHIVLDEGSLVSKKVEKTSEIENDDLPAVSDLGESYLLSPYIDIPVPLGSEEEGLVEAELLVPKWNQVRWKNRNAMLVYTSGTTGRPKGVVLTHGNVQAQTTSLTSSWGWSSRDVVLHTLPLHHTHGIINLLCCPLWCGATCVMIPSFDPGQLWERLLSDDQPRINVFMAVPTIYAKLIDYYNEKLTTPKVQAFIRATCKEKIRLMVSGSAALPQPIMEKWEEITGHRLLERYGMTELGMALSNPLHGPRIAGAVGNPLPTVEVRIRSSDGETIVKGNASQSQVSGGHERTTGDLEVKGPSVFKEYWQRQDATDEAFTSDGWFKTGDTAMYEDGRYRIMGRTSVDIIKSGGYKISALDIERRIMSHELVSECIVVGLPDMTWGQRVAAVIVSRSDTDILDLRTLREWAKDKMPPYIIPTELKVLPHIPKNAMGKVNKKSLLKDVFGVKV